MFKFPSRKAITRIQTSRNVDISRHSNGHILVVREATVRWLGVLVVLHVLCMLLWPWPDPTSSSRSLTFWSTENLRTGRGYNLVIVDRPQQAMHAGSDNRHSVSPLVGLFMVALWNRADHYIFPCGFFFFFLLSFFSSPNVSRRRLDVCHTSTHGVALVRI